MKKTNPFSNTIFLFFFILALMIILKLFILDIVFVSGDSMETSIHDGQLIVINKLAYGIVKPFSTDFFVQWDSPKTNDIICYLYNNKSVIKRCVATELTPLEFYTNTEYSVKVNEKIIPLTDAQYHRLKNSFIVPQGMCFAVGDNYLKSIDSRNYGFVSIKNVTGKVLCK